MRLAVSNIGLPSFDHTGYFGPLAELGAQGIEVAPSKVWEDVTRVTPGQAAAYARAAGDHGLSVVGLHSLFFGLDHLNIFDAATRSEALALLARLSSLCEDMGGRTLIFGSPGARRRGPLPTEQADELAATFFADLCEATRRHATVFCVEPLGASETDYVSSVDHALALVRRVDHPRFAVHMDAKALWEAGEIRRDVFDRAAVRLAHFHANDPGLVAVGHTGEIDHRALGRLLKAVGYTGFVSAEQRMPDGEAPLAALARSLATLKECYA